MKKGKSASKNRRRGIFILPNIFTSMNLFFGFYAIISALDGQFESAAVFILIAVICDMLDGKIARATRTTSAFGMEYDSLADLISFGLAPGLVVYLWALQPLGRMGWLAAFMFTVCGALRLARFNTQSGTTGNDYFTGLPIPAAAGMNATFILMWHRVADTGRPNAILTIIAIYVLSFLMVSTIKYHSFKKPELFNRVNFNALVTVVLVLIFIAAQPSIALFLLGATYVASGPFFSLWVKREARGASSVSFQESGEPEAESPDRYHS